MLKPFAIVLLLCGTISAAVSAESHDFAQVRQHFIEIIPTTELGENHQAPNAQGQWADVDYQHKAKAGWKTIKHLTRCLQLTIYAKNSGTLRPRNAQTAFDHSYKSAIAAQTGG